MKKIVCDLCGESDFVKVNGFFECQVCGAKYTVAEARNMFVDVDEDGTVHKSPAKTNIVKQPTQISKAIFHQLKKNQLKNGSWKMGEIINRD